MRLPGLRIASVYLPNGNPAPGPRFDYKLAWLARLHRHAGMLLDEGVPTVLAGDFNVVPTDADIYNWWLWRHDAVLQPETRAAWQEFLAQGWIDVTRARRPHERIYSFWVNTDAFRRNAGFRMDFLLASHQLLPRVTGDGATDVDPREFHYKLTVNNNLLYGQYTKRALRGNIVGTGMVQLVVAADRRPRWWDCGYS